jgi:hypothetical protein
MADQFSYRLIVDGRVVSENLILTELLALGDLCPLAETGGRVTKVVKLAGEERRYEIHVRPLDE